MFMKRSWNESTSKTDEKNSKGRSGVKPTPSTKGVPANTSTWSDKMKEKMGGLKEKMNSAPKMPTMRIPSFTTKPIVESSKHDTSKSGASKKDDQQDKASAQHKQGHLEPAQAPQGRLTSLASAFSFGKAAGAGAATEGSQASGSKPDKPEGGGLLSYLRRGKKGQEDAEDKLERRQRAASDTDSEASSKAAAKLGPKSKAARATRRDATGEPDDADDASPRDRRKSRAASEKPVKAKRQESEEDPKPKRKPAKDKSKSQRERDDEGDADNNKDRQANSGGEGSTVAEGERPSGSARRRKAPADGERSGPSEKSDSKTRSRTKRASQEEEATSGSKIAPPPRTGASGQEVGDGDGDVTPRDKGKGKTKTKTKKKDAGLKDEDNTSEASARSKGSASSHATNASNKKDVSVPKGPPKPRIKELAFFTVHSSGPLEPNVHMTAPVVRIHLLDAASGEPLRCQERNAGRRAGEEVEEGARRVASVQTLPFALKERKGLALAAKWDQRICVEEVEAERVVHADTLVLIEVLQLPSSFSTYSTDSAAFRNGVFRVAWGFLKLVDKQGRKKIGRTKVQLYRYCSEPTKLDLSLLRFKPKPKPGSPLPAYQSWCRLRSLAPERHPTYCTWLELSVDVEPHPLTQLDEESAWQLTPSRPTLTQRVENERAFGGLADEDNVKSGRDQIRQKLGRVPVEQLLGQMTLSQQMPEEPEEEEQGAHQMPQVPVREAGDECQVPNTVHSTVVAGPRGCNLVAFSPDGSMLASVCEGKLKFAVRIHLTASGACVHSFSGHHEMVYDLGWSADNAFVTTASSDFTAKVWAAHPEQGAASHSAPQPHQVLQHACFVYAAAFHPTFTKPLVVATGAYDKTVRLWNCETGEQLFALSVHQACVNTLAFDALGKRLYTGDGEGVVKELSCDTRGRASKSQLGISEELEPEVIKLRRMNLKLLRSCSELMGEPVAHVRMHPQGRRLIVLTKRSRLCEIDIKLLIVSHNFAGVKCTLHPLKVEVSPDGRYIICGSEDGRVTLWECQSRKEHAMASYQIAKDMVYSVAWNKTHHALALAYHDCTAPIAVHKFDSKKPPALPKSKDVAFLAAPKVTDKKQLYPALPDHLTPSVVAEMMASIRSSKEHLMERVGNRLRQSKQRAQVSKEAAELAAQASNESQSDDEEVVDVKPGSPPKPEAAPAPAVSDPPAKQFTAEPIPDTSARPHPSKHIDAVTTKPEVPLLDPEKSKARIKSKTMNRGDAKPQKAPQAGSDSDTVAAKVEAPEKAETPQMVSKAIPGPVQPRPESFGLAADLLSEASKLPVPQELPPREKHSLAPLPALAPLKPKAKLPDVSAVKQPETFGGFGLIADLATDPASAVPTERPKPSAEQAGNSNAPASTAQEPAAEEFGLAADVVKDEENSTREVEEVTKKPVLQPLQQPSFGLEADLHELEDIPSPVPFPTSSKHTPSEDAKNRSRSSSPDADQWIPAMQQTSTSSTSAMNVQEDTVKEDVASNTADAPAPSQPPPQVVPKVQALGSATPSQAQAPLSSLPPLSSLSRPAPLSKLEKWSSGGGFGLLEELEEVPDAASRAPTAGLVALPVTAADALAPAPSPPPPRTPAEEPDPEPAPAPVLAPSAPSTAPAMMISEPVSSEAASSAHMSTTSCLTELASTEHVPTAPAPTVPEKMEEQRSEASTEEPASDLAPDLDHGGALTAVVLEPPSSPMRESEGETLTYPIDHGPEEESDVEGVASTPPQSGKHSELLQAPFAQRASSGWGVESSQPAPAASHGSSTLPAISTPKSVPTVLDESVESLDSEPVGSTTIATPLTSKPDLAVVSKTEDAQGDAEGAPSTSIPDDLFVARETAMPVPPSKPKSSEGTSICTTTRMVGGFGLEEVTQDSAPSAPIVAATPPTPETTQHSPVKVSEDIMEVSYSDTFDEVELGTMTVPKDGSSMTPKTSEMAKAAKEVQDMISQEASIKVASGWTSDPAPQPPAQDNEEDTIPKAVDAESIDNLTSGNSGHGDSGLHAVSSENPHTEPPIDNRPPSTEPTKKAVVMHEEDMEIEDMMDEFM